MRGNIWNLTSMDRSHAILVCPDNDAEARMILMIAEKAKIPTVKSLKPHGGRLDVEVEEVKKLISDKTKEVWIVELPSIEKEKELRDTGLKVEIIDHHTYKDFDRLTNPKTGKKNPSSLEQFLSVANITDEELKSFGFVSKIVRGVGISDALWVNGLKNAGYTDKEIKEVFNYTSELSMMVNPELEKSVMQAKLDWDKRQERNGYIVALSHSRITDIRGAISFLAAMEGFHSTPKIISVWSGDKISVENVGLDIVEKLNRGIKGDTFTFGSGMCWAVNNKGLEKRVTLEEIFEVLGI